MSITRNNKPWDKNYDYSWMDTLDLLGFFFPEAKNAAEDMDVMYLNLDDDRGVAVKSALKALKENKTRLALFCLLVNNPYSVRDDLGRPAQHAVMLAVNTEKNEICYQDPYGLGLDDKLWHSFSERERFNMPQLSVIMREVLPGYNLMQTRLPQQFDDHSSVPITITNMIYYALAGTVPETVDVGGVRETHLHILLDADKRREELRWKKYNLCIAAVAREIVSSARGEFSINKAAGEALEDELSHLMKDLCMQTKCTTFSFLSDERIPPKLTRVGKKLRNELYAAIKHHHIITRPKPAEVQANNSNQAIINTVKLYDEFIRYEFFRLIAATLNIDSFFESAEMRA